MPLPAQVGPVAYDCWNQIGVFGNGRCKELASVVHCRSCPVFSAAGVQLLDRERPAGDKQVLARYYSQPKKAVTLGRLSAVVFRIGSEWLALSTKVFQEIAELRSIHSLPHRRNGVVLGITNVRGELLVCVSLGRLLGLDWSAGTSMPGVSGKRLVVAEWQSSVAAFPVDDVYGVQRFHPEEVQPAPAGVGRGGEGLIRSLLTLKEHKAGLLDEEAVFAAVNQSLS